MNKFLAYLPLIILLQIYLQFAYGNVQQIHMENENLAEIIPEEKFIQNPTTTVDDCVLANVTQITTSPAPPLVERIEIRLVDAENTTEETPLIIVDVVKKNNGSGVAATIQQQHRENLELNRPSQGFLVRLKQPNYHSIAYIPYEGNLNESTASTPPPMMTTAEISKIEKETANVEISTSPNEIETTTETSENFGTTTMDPETMPYPDDDHQMGASMATTTAENAGLGEMVQIVPIDKIDGQKEDKKLESNEKADEEPIEEKIAENEEEKMIEKGIDAEENLDESAENDQILASENEGKIAEKLEEEIEDKNEELMDEENAKMFNESELGQQNGGTNSSTGEFGFDLRGEGEGEEIVGGEEGIHGNGGNANEECLANRGNLKEEVVKRLISERRRIVQSIKKINKHQMLLCRPNREQNQVPYRKCPMWRREKFFLYYALMRITYCGNHARWPGGRRFRAVL